MRLKTVVFVLVLILLNAGAAFYVMTRVQMQVFLDPNALAFRIGSQMPAGSTDRGTEVLSARSEIPGLGHILISSQDGARTFRFQKVFHGEGNTSLRLAQRGTGISFTGAGPGASLEEAVELGGQFGTFLTGEGFTPNQARVEQGCLRLDRMAPDDGPKAEAIERAVRSGGCGARPGSFIVFRADRGKTSVSAIVVPDDGRVTGDISAAKFSLMVNMFAGEIGSN
jgi:hypothetical protein